MFRLFIAIISLSVSLAAPSFAQDTPAAQNVSLTPNYVVSVNGMVCEFCSFGVAKKIRKLDFIDSSKLDQGVKVEIENQRVFIAVRDNAKLDKHALYGAIESGGYQPVTLWNITHSGEHMEVE